MPEPYLFKPVKAPQVAQEWSRKIHDARRKGVTPDGLKHLEADRRKAVSDALLAEAGTVVNEHRRRMKEIEAKHPEVRVPVTSVELSARHFELERTRDRIQLMSDTTLQKRLESEIADPLNVDRDVLAMLGVEAQRRGSEDLRQVVAMTKATLSTPAYKSDPDWQAANSTVSGLEYWHDVVTGKKATAGALGDVMLPSGFGTLNSLIKQADRETAPAPEMRPQPGTIGDDSAWHAAVEGGVAGE